MKAKVKKGHDLLFSEGISNKWNNLKDCMIINFKNKYTYKNFSQKNNHLLIDTTEGHIVIVFCGEIPKLQFDHFEKDQLVLNIVN
jgi:hypothetical protein